MGGKIVIRLGFIGNLTILGKCLLKINPRIDGGPPSCVFIGLAKYVRCPWVLQVQHIGTSKMPLGIGDRT